MLWYYAKGKPKEKSKAKRTADAVEELLGDVSYMCSA
jgi:hypothetical protein